MDHTPTTAPAWQQAIFKVLKEGNVRQIAYVPDAGHSHVIRSAIADPDIQDVVLTTEEEGVAVVSGAWLGGQRAVLLMQSSGVGNCVNMFSLLRSANFPVLHAGDDARRVRGLQPVARARWAGPPRGRSS